MNDRSDKMALDELAVSLTAPIPAYEPDWLASEDRFHAYVDVWGEGK